MPQLDIPRAYTGGYQNAWAPMAESLSSFGDSLVNKASDDKKLEMLNARQLIEDQRYNAEKARLAKLDLQSDPTTPEGQAYALAAAKSKREAEIAANPNLLRQEQVDKQKLDDYDMNRRYQTELANATIGSEFVNTPQRNAFLATSEDDKKLNAMDKKLYGVNQAPGSASQNARELFNAARSAYEQNRMDQNEVGYDVSNLPENFIDTAEGKALQDKLIAATVQPDAKETAMRKDYMNNLDGFFRAERPEEMNLRIAKMYGSPEIQANARTAVISGEQATEAAKLANIKEIKNKLDAEEIRVENAKSAANAANAKYVASLTKDPTGKVIKKPDQMKLSDFIKQTGMDEEKATKLYNSLAGKKHLTVEGVANAMDKVGKKDGYWTSAKPSTKDFAGLTSIEDATDELNPAKAGKAAPGAKVITSRVNQLKEELRLASMTDEEKTKDLMNKLHQVVSGNTTPAKVTTITAQKNTGVKVPASKGTTVKGAGVTPALGGGKGKAPKLGKNLTVTGEDLSNKAAPVPGVATVNKIKPGYQLVAEGVTDLGKNAYNMTIGAASDYFNDKDGSKVKAVAASANDAVAALANNAVASTAEIVGSPYTAAKMFTDWLIDGKAHNDSVFTKNANAARDNAVTALKNAGIKNPTQQQIAIIGSELLIPGTQISKLFTKTPKLAVPETINLINKYGDNPDALIKSGKFLENKGAPVITVSPNGKVVPTVKKRIEQLFGY